MADLNPLIRFRKHKLEEKQKNLARLYNLLDQLLENKESLLRGIESEQQYIKNSVEDIYALQSLNSFFLASKHKIKIINQDIEKMEARIEIGIEDMRITFGDLKKIELTQERRLQKQQKELLDKETKLFDEIGLEMHRRHTS